MVDIEKHIIQNRITGRAADRVHDHFGLFRQKPDDLAEVIGFVDILDDRGIPHKRYFCRSVVAVHGFADLQVEICQEQLDFRYLTGNMRKSMFQFGQCLYRHPAVTGLDISHKAPGIIGKGSLCERHGSVMPYRAGVGIGAGSGLIGRICIAGTGGIRQHFISDGVLLWSTEKTAFKQSGSIFIGQIYLIQSIDRPSVSQKHGFHRTAFLQRMFIIVIQKIGKLVQAVAAF